MFISRMNTGLLQLRPVTVSRPFKTTAIYVQSRWMREPSYPRFGIATIQNTHLASVMSQSVILQQFEKPFSTDHRGNDRGNRRQAYDVNRERIVQGIQQNSQILSSSLHHSSGPSWKTVVVLIACSSSLTMLFYVLFRIYRSEGTDDTKKRIFLPLWFHSNILYKKKYRFPTDLEYFDASFAAYLEDYINTNFSSLDSDRLNGYLRSLEDDCIKYKAAHELTISRYTRHVIGLPLRIESCGNLSIWIESDKPTISGLQLQFESKPNASLREKLSTISFGWVIKPMNLGSSTDEFLAMTGWKLDTIQKPKSPDKTSGRVHEAHSSDAHTVPSSLRVNGNAFAVRFAGDLHISDVNSSLQGILHYQGMLDPDHILILKGVKLQDMVLTVNQGPKTKDKVSYKIK